MKPLWLLLACLLAVPVFAASLASIHDAEIRALIEAFRTSIIKKDKARFVALFVPGHVTWQSTRSDLSVERMRQNDPQALKTRFNPESTYLTFIDNIAGDNNSNEEIFDNIRIDSDGEIASVTFDYRFLRAGVEINHGQENWQLLRTDAGWRIIAVIWSVNLAAEPISSP